MKDDPIVEEVRNAGKNICLKYNNDLKKVCRFLREKEETHPKKIVSRKPIQLSSK